MKRTEQPTEHAEQVALIKWWRLQHPDKATLLIAIPNGGARNLRTGVMLKAEGTCKGVPDLLLAIPCGGRHGLWIEMKRRANSYATPEQKAMIATLRSVGYDAAVCQGWEAAKTKIEQYLGVAKEDSLDGWR